MNSMYYRFSLDIQSVQSQISLPVSLYDTARTLYMSFTDRGKPYIIEDGCLAKLTITRPSGSKLHEFCPIERNDTVIYSFLQNKNTAAEEGIHDCEVTLYGTNGEQITSPRFSMVVSDRVVNKDDNNGLDDDSIGIIDEIVHMEQARRSAEEIRVSAENERISAEAGRVEAETERADAESYRVAFWGNKAAVYIGEGEMPEGYNVQIDPSGEATDIERAIDEILDIQESLISDVPIDPSDDVTSQPVSVDLSKFDTDGTIVETYTNGATKTTTMEFDENGNPTKITDGDGNVTTLTW